MFRKQIALLVVVALVFGMLPGAVFADADVDTARAFLEGAIVESRARLLETVKAAEPELVPSGSWWISPALWNALEFEANATQLVVDNPDSSLEDLHTAMNGLIPSLNTFGQERAWKNADKVALTNAINAQIGADRDNPAQARVFTEYTPDSWSNYSSAIASSVTIEIENFSTQTQIDAALADLANAVAGLVFENAQALSNVTAAAASMQSANYTPTSWSMFGAMLGSASGLPHSTHAQIAQKIASIQNAISALVFRGDKTALAAKLVEASELISTTAMSADGTDVLTNEYWASAAVSSNFSMAVSAAQSVNSDDNSTQLMVNNATTSLTNAIANFNSARALGTMAIEITIINESELSAAITAAATDGSPTTIKLGANITVASTQIITNKNIILDLNGHTLSSSTNTITLSGTGGLEVKDTSLGAAGVLSGSNRAIYNNGTGSVTVSSGMVTSDVNTINNQSTGSVTVSGGTVSTTSESSNAITNSSSGGVTISGGTVTSNGYTISNSGNGNVTVSGGTVSGTAYTIWNNNSEGTINVFSGQVSSSGNVAIMSNGGVANVSGGTISSSVISISSTGTLNISGGTLQAVSLSVLNISGNPTLTVGLSALTSKKVSITGALTGADGSITLNAQGLVNTEAGTVVATATDPDNANASKFVLTNATGKTLAKSGADIVFAADSPTGPPTDWNGIIPTSDPGIAYSGGSGTEASPYLIANSYDLAMLASNVNTTTDYSVDKHFKMTADINLNPGISVIDATTTAKEWTPIGKNLMEFKGVFDGGGFAIKGMYLKDIAGLQYYGLFGKITNATIKNLGVTNSFVNIIINSSANAAGIIGYARYSTVESCYNTANVNGYHSVGGILGYSGITTVKNCYNTGEISVTSTYAGGIVGQAGSTIFKDCYNTGNISGNMIVGGIVGSNRSDNVSIPTAMYRCYNTGNVVAAFSDSNSSSHFGSSGIVGSFHSPTAAQLDSCVSLGLSVSSTTTVGPNMTTRVAKGDGVITNSYARSDMKVNGNTVFSFSTTNEHGKNLLVAQNTAQDWSTWFGSAGSLAWDYPADGKLWYQAPLPTLKGVGGIQNPTLPGTGSGVTETYTVTYIGNGATSGSVTAQTTNVGTATTVAANGFTKTGYTFAGWNTAANGTGTVYGAGGTVPSKAAGTTVTLYAQWLQDVPPPGQTYTVTYHGNGATSGSVTAQTTNVGTATTVAANGFTKTGYTFAGWNTAANGSGTAYGAGGTVPSQTAGTTFTLYARWTEITYAVSGTVKDNNNTNVSGASVKLVQGNTQIGNTVTTGADGTFLITGVPNGKYNLVVEKDGIVVTTLITVSNGDYASGTIQLPAGKTNSVVEVNGSETPQIVVGNLDGQFSTTATDNEKGVTSDDNTVVTGGGSVEIKLIAEKKDDTAANATTISAIATSNGNTVGIFIDLSVLKTVKNSVGAEITTQSAILTELPSLIDVLIPLPAALQGKENYVVYRYHGSAVDRITTTAVDGEKIELVDNNTTIKLTVKKFSTYAIAYTTPAPNNPGSGSGGGSSSSAASSTIAAVSVKESALPYYIKNGEKVYIGFSVFAGKLYKYIAPTGETVEFRENPKNFTDNTIAWAKPSIDFVTERELFLGTSQDTFSPNESMTRAMFVTVIGRLYERSYNSVSGTSTFSDVNANAYYAKYVAWANENGIIKGIGENQFAPEAKVTREQMAVIMLNFADFLNKADITGSSLAYADSQSISSWALDGAKYCQETKVITGREGGSFAPQESATRAEVAAVINRFIKIIVK